MIYQSFISIYLPVFHCSLSPPFSFLWLRPTPPCISLCHPPQPPPPARLNPLRQCVWSAPTIDRYIVPDRLDRATGQQMGGGWGQQASGVGGGGGLVLGNVCFSVSNLVRPEELHTPLRLKHTIHDGLTYMITHKCPLLTYTHTHYHNHAQSLKAHQPHGENLSPSSSFIVPWFVIANAVPNYTPVNVITLLSSASLNDFSPLSLQLWKVFSMCLTAFLDVVSTELSSMFHQLEHREHIVSCSSQLFHLKWIILAEDCCVWVQADLCMST